MLSFSFVCCFTVYSKRGSIAYTALSRRWVWYWQRWRCLVWTETEMSCMAGDHCWLWYRLMAFSRTCTFVYIGLVALLDRIQSSFSSITIETTSLTLRYPNYKIHRNMFPCLLPNRQKSKDAKCCMPRGSGLLTTLVIPYILIHLSPHVLSIILSVQKMEHLRPPGMSSKCSIIMFFYLL